MGAGDAIDLTGRGFSFQTVMANASNIAGGTLLDLGKQQITLLGVNTVELAADDFLL